MAHNHEVAGSKPAWNDVSVAQWKSAVCIGNSILIDKIFFVKNYIQDQYDNPDIHPEFVTLVGDVGGSYNIPAFYESITGYGATADHPYSELEGSDMFPDMFLGRISVRNTNELNVVCNKIVHYEKATYIEETGTDWYEAAALIGDPGSSGMSTFARISPIGLIFAALAISMSDLILVIDTLYIHRLSLFQVFLKTWLKTPDQIFL